MVLDATSALERPGLTSVGQTVDRWFHVVSLVQGAPEGGRVVLVGPTGNRAVQALIRNDPVGWARRELADRLEAGFPPATCAAIISGSDQAVQAAVEQLADQEARPAGGVLSTRQARVRTARRALAALGYAEAVTWSFTKQSTAALFGGGDVERRLVERADRDVGQRARGLLDRVFTRAYLDPEGVARDLADVPAERRSTLAVIREQEAPGRERFRFDIRLQGSDETVFLEFSPATASPSDVLEAQN